MIVPEIAFVRPIPILGTFERRDRFYASEGWTIDVHDYGVTLSKPASQNVPEIPAFCTCGVGYSVPEDPKERQLQEMLAAGIISEGDGAAIRAGYGSHEEMVKALTTEAGDGIGHPLSEATLGNETLNAEKLISAAPNTARKGRRSL